MSVLTNTQVWGLDQGILHCSYCALEQLPAEHEYHAALQDIRVHREQSKLDYPPIALALACVHRTDSSATQWLSGVLVCVDAAISDDEFRQINSRIFQTICGTPLSQKTPTAICLATDYLTLRQYCSAYRDRLTEMNPTLYQWILTLPLAQELLLPVKQHHPGQPNGLPRMI